MITLGRSTLLGILGRERPLKHLGESENLFHDCMKIHKTVYRLSSFFKQKEQPKKVQVAASTCRCARQLDFRPLGP